MKEEMEENSSPLKRKDKVYRKLRELTESLHPEKGEDQRMGFEAGFIGELTGVSRNNTSKELNRLLREGRAIKIQGKPVLYIDIQLICARAFLDCMTYRKKTVEVKLSQLSQRVREVKKGFPTDRSGIK